MRISSLSAIWRHDARLLGRLLPDPARCISGVCAAKRCGNLTQAESDAAAKGSAGRLSRTAAWAPGPGRSPAGFRPFPPVERAPPEAERAEATEHRDQSESASGYGSTPMGRYMAHQPQNKFFDTLSREDPEFSGSFTALFYDFGDRFSAVPVLKFRSPGRFSAAPGIFSVRGGRPPRTFLFLPELTARDARSPQSGTAASPARPGSFRPWAPASWRYAH